MEKLTDSHRNSNRDVAGVASDTGILMIIYLKMLLYYTNYLIKLRFF